MDIAVIIPCYNSAEWVGAAVESVLAQAAPPAEVIVVNDGSTDGGRAVLRRYEPHIRVIDQENQGLSGARNSGARAARSPWLAFLDADDLYDREFVRGVGELHAAFPEAELLFTDSTAFMGDDVLTPALIGRFVPEARALAERSCGDLLLCGRPFVEALIRLNGAFPPSAMVVHRGLFERVGGFFAGLYGSQDLDFYIHAAPETRVGVALWPLLRKREHPASMNRRYDAMRPDLEVVWERAKASLRRRHPDLLPVARRKYIGQLISWGWHEYRTGKYRAARTTFARAVRDNPSGLWHWYGLAAATVRGWAASVARPRARRSA
jgi:glycosyltransferase involved in cell wall biosynthesis